jgi:hypothetical protein
VDDDESKWIAIKNYWHLDKTEFLLSKDSNRVFQDAGSVSRTGDNLWEQFNLALLQYEKYFLFSISL